MNYSQRNQGTERAASIAKASLQIFIVFIVLLSFCKLFEFERMEDVALCNCQLKRSFFRSVIGLENDLEFVSAYLSLEPIRRYRVIIIRFAGRTKVFSVRHGLRHPRSRIVPARERELSASCRNIINVIGCLYWNLCFPNHRVPLPVRVIAAARCEGEDSKHHKHDSPNLNSFHS